MLSIEHLVILPTYIRYLFSIVLFFIVVMVCEYCMIMPLDEQQTQLMNLNAQMEKNIDVLQVQLIEFKDETLSETTFIELLPFSLSTFLKSSGSRLIRWQSSGRSAELELSLPWVRLSLFFEVLSRYRNISMMEFQIDRHKYGVKIALMMGDENEID